MTRTDLRHVLRAIVTHPRVTGSDAVFASRMTNLHQAGLDFSPEERVRLEATIQKYVPATVGESANV